MNQRHFKYTWVATLLSAVMLSGLTACSNEDNVTNGQTAQEGPTYKVSIAAAIGNEAQTRAVEYNSTTGGLDTKFLTTDYIAVANMTTGALARTGYYDYTYLRPDAEGKTANLTGNLIFTNRDNPSEKQEVSVGQTLRLMYSTLDNNGSFTYNSQSGTFSNLRFWDYAFADVKIESVTGDKDNGYTLTTSKASFVNAQSMYKFSFTGLDDGAGIQTLTIHSAKNKLVRVYLPYAEGSSGEYSFDDATILLNDWKRSENGPGVVYAALRFQPVGEGETDVITFIVKDTNNKEYITTKTAPVGGFQNGKFYTSAIDLNKKADELSGNIDISTLDNAVIADGSTLTGTLSGNHRIFIADGASVTLNGVTLSSSAQAGIVCKGSATITLVGTNNVSSSKSGCAGIQAGPAGSTLTIQGSGSLTATGANGGAGIGSGESTTCGNIVIAGGTVTASGGVRSAGIGSGGNGSYCGDITISGGTVVANGDPASSDNTDSGGAGIGSGGGYRSSSAGTVCGKITITGGNVTATGGRGCAGIGSGTSYSNPYGDPSSCGDIEISGGTVIANGGFRAPGIGSGMLDGGNTNPKYTKCGNILISGGTVTATGGHDAIAIGSGRHQSGSVLFYCGTITITEGITKIVANNEWGPERPVGTSTMGADCRSVTIDGTTYDVPFDVPQEHTYEHLKLTNNGHQVYTIEPKH